MLRRKSTVPEPAAPPYSGAPVDAGGATPALSDRRFVDLVAFTQVTEEDLALLASAGVEAAGDAIVESFYGHVLRQPELRAIIERTTTVERLGRTLRTYRESIFSGTLDDRRLRASVTSVRCTTGSTSPSRARSARPCGSTAWSSPRSWRASATTPRRWSRRSWPTARS